MKTLRCFLLLFFLVLVSASVALAADYPPWDTGHESFRGDDGDEDTDPGDDSPYKSGSPVELASGNLVYNERDLRIAGLGPAIDILRTYNSRDMRSGPFGNGWVFAYDQRLTETTDETHTFAIFSQLNGKRERFVRQPDGKAYLSPPHLFSPLIRNADGSHRLRDKYGLVEIFGPGGRLAAIQDRNGNTLAFAYDATGFPTAITDASGRTVRFIKGANGKIVSMIDPANRTFSYAYDGNGNLIRFTDPLGNSTTYQYDAKKNLTAVIDPRGNKLMGATHDGEGRVATLQEGAETWTFTYLTNPRRTQKRDSSNRIWTYLYNDAGNITQLTDPLGNSETYAYDANVNLTQLTDKNGNITRFTYDAWGNPSTITDALGNTREFTHDINFSLPLTVRDRLGNETRYEYDDRGNLIRTINALGEVTQFRYDSKGQLLSLTDPLGNTSRFAYDAYGNPVRTTDPLGNSSTATFDILGRALSATDPEGRSVQYAYDDNGRRTGTTDPRGGASVNVYDASGNLTSVTLQNGARTTFEYDSFNRLIRVTNPLGQSTSLGYDRKNNLTSKTNARGQVIQYTYDALDRMIRKLKPGETVSYTYDRVGNLLTVGDADSGLIFVHDALNRVVETSTGSANQPPTTITYTYDANGNRRSMTDPGDGVTNYTYDALSRVVSLTDPGAQTYGFSYDKASRRIGMARSGDLTTAYGYDATSRLVSLLHQSGAGDLGFAYTYDRVGNRLSAADAGGLHSYSYDALYRLAGAAHPGGTDEIYAYDSVGNRTSSHLSTYTHDIGNRLTADTQFDYAYDATGNLIRKTDRGTGQAMTFTYDAENQLTRINFPGGRSASYRYDGLGRRIEKNVNGQITRYVYDGQDILFEYAGSIPQARYTHGPAVDEVLSVRRGGSTSFFEADGSGSVVRVTDGVSVKASYTYDSYGRVTGQMGSPQGPYLFQGREYDSESGLFYFRSRYYDPMLGRFLSEDPLTFAGGSNFYLFALDNPVNFLDPFGLEPVSHSWLDRFQTFLDFVGLIPGLGEPVDLLNAGIYGLRGDALNASLSLGSAVPFLGWGTTGAKLGIKATKALPAGARLLQQDLEHIVLRHWATSGAKNAGKFAPDTSLRNLRDMIRDTVSQGASRPNTRNRPGTIYEHTFSQPIGTNTAGSSTGSLRVIVRPDGTVVTAFPY